MIPMFKKLVVNSEGELIYINPVRDFILKFKGWIPCSERLPKKGKTVKIKYKKWESEGYISPFNGMWQHLFASAMTIDENSGIEVDYWKEDRD